MKKLRRKRKVRSQRYGTPIARPYRRLRPLIKTSFDTLKKPRYDLRYFDPTGRNLRRSDGILANYTLRDKKGHRKGQSQTKATFSFQNPKKVLTCQRRSERRQALFSRKRAGKGIPGPKIRKRRPESSIRCR